MGEVCYGVVSSAVRIASLFCWGVVILVVLCWAYVEQLWWGVC